LMAAERDLGRRSHLEIVGDPQDLAALHLQAPQKIPAAEYDSRQRENHRRPAARAEAEPPSATRCAPPGCSDPG
jgi:hypothetical protein